LSTEQDTLPQKSRVSRIHVGRVYNLGNYENMRVEVTVEIGTDDDPGKVLHSVENILGDLRASAGVDDWQLSRARRILAKPEEELDEDDRQRLDGAREAVAKVEAAMLKRQAAREALTTLNYRSEHKDHKEDWEDEGDY
jgi:predicted RNA binding protein with dsRBD fold (UPF0201 family)